MTSIDTLILAIKSRKPITFQYNKIGKVNGPRIGNPHAVFIFTSKKGEISTKVHIVQTGGVSDTLEDDTDFRTFNLEELSDIKIIEDAGHFEPYYAKYNPNWSGYKDVIEKI